MQVDQQMVKQVLRDTISSVCDSLLSFNHEVRVEGMIGISVDTEQMIVVHVHERISKDLPISTVCGQCGSDAQESVILNKRLSTKPVPSANVSINVPNQRKKKPRSKRTKSTEGKVLVVKAEVHHPQSLDGEPEEVIKECHDEGHLTSTNGTDACTMNRRPVKYETDYSECGTETESEELVNGKSSDDENQDPSYTTSSDSSTYTLRKRFQRAATQQTEGTKKNGKTEEDSFSLASSADEILPLDSSTNPNTTDSTTFPCPICGKHFHLKGLMNRHVKQVHNGEKDFPCTDCHRKFFDKTKFLNHRKVAHQGFRHKCPHCAREFRTLRSAKHHISLKKCNKSKYRCGYCDTQYGNARAYKLHMQCHISSKVRLNNQCGKCNKKFQSKHGLKGHITICGSKEKPFRCDLCPKGFAAERYMKEHMKIHTEPYRYECNFCEKRFNYRRNLLFHRQREHPENILND